MTAAAGLAGAPLTTYTGVLVADTATPVWHEARFELPPLFAASAAASAGGVTTMLATLAGPPDTGAARVGALGAAAEVVIATIMQHRLGPLDTYSSDPAAHRFERARRLAVDRRRRRADRRTTLTPDQLPGGRRRHCGIHVPAIGCAPSRHCLGAGSSLGPDRTLRRWVTTRPRRMARRRAT